MDTPYEKLLAKLARADVKFIIVGGVAVALNGFLRTTEDVDILIESSADSVIRTALIYPLCDRCALEIADKTLLSCSVHFFCVSRTIGTKRTGNVALSFS